MVWIGERHALPPLPTRRVPAMPSSGAESGVPINATGNMTVPQNVETGAQSAGSPLTLILFIVLTLIPLIVIYMVSAGTLIYRSRRLARTPSTPAGRGYERYRYEGLRRIIRQLYLGVLEEARRVTGALRPGYTPREVESILTDIGLAEPGMARLYEEYMYSPREPGPREIEKFRRHVKVG